MKDTPIKSITVYLAMIYLGTILAITGIFSMKMDRKNELIAKYEEDISTYELRCVYYTDTINDLKVAKIDLENELNNNKVLLDTYKKRLEEAEKALERSSTEATDEQIAAVEQMLDKETALIRQLWEDMQ